MQHLQVILPKLLVEIFLAHATTYRIFFRKAGHNRIAVMQDSPYHEYGSVKFSISEKGVVDAEDDKKTGKANDSESGW